MKIKSIDIARRLGISKTSVSLALNNKPGISENTREAVFNCLEELEREQKMLGERKGTGAIIKILVVHRHLHVVQDAEIDLWPDALKVFDKEAKKVGYSIGISYVDFAQDDVEDAIQECNTPLIAGVILYATEMTEEDFEPFKKIEKPMIVYDNDFGEQFHSVTIDNNAAAQMCVERLASSGCENIVYLAQNIDIFNFEQRRDGFWAAIHKYPVAVDENHFVRIGTTIQSVQDNMEHYLDTHPLPDAFVMENYQISIGVLRALHNRQIRVPEQVSLIGIDDLPSYVMVDCVMDTIRLSHKERAEAAMMILMKEIEEQMSVKFRLLSRCVLLEGNSVRKSK